VRIRSDQFALSYIIAAVVTCDQLVFWIGESTRRPNIIIILTPVENAYVKDKDYLDVELPVLDKIGLN
jgi:hypothetical protein